MVQRSKRWRWIPVLVAAPLFGHARPAPAQGEPMALAWQAPPGCPTTADVTDQVRQNRAGLKTVPAPFAAAVGVVGPTAGRWLADVSFQARSIHAERRFEAESCEAVASAAALMIALWADGGAEAAPTAGSTAGADLAPPPQERAGGQTPAEPPEDRAVIISSAPPAAAAPAARRFTLAVGGVLDGRTLPGGSAGGLEVTAGLSGSNIGWRGRLFAGLGFFPAQHAAVDYQFSFPDNSLRLFDLSGRGCLTFAEIRVEMGPCGGVALDVMNGSGAPFQVNTQVWLSAVGGLMAVWHIAPLVTVFTRAEGVVSATRRTFTVARDAVSIYEIYRTPSTTGRVALGLELHFR